MEKKNYDEQVQIPVFVLQVPWLEQLFGQLKI